MTFTGRELRSTIAADGKLTLSLGEVSIADVADDEIVVRVEAAPINPSDLGALIGPADMSTLAKTGETEVTLRVPEHRLPVVRARLGEAIPVGNEGAGLVVAAGRSVAALEGKRVGMFGGAMYADYRKIKAQDAILLPRGTTSAQGASMTVNPLTALGFVETAKRHGHRAIVHTAAASNLGQMLQKICLADGMPLVNVVRTDDQVELLRGLGAAHVLSSKTPDFGARLVDAIEATGATVAFDAIGGGSLGSDILRAMEAAAVRRTTGYSRYGSDTFKQLYVYGALDLSPVILDRMGIGYQWSVSGWLLTPFLASLRPTAAKRLRKRVLDELTSTFASHYTRTIGLSEAVQPDVLRAYERKATGEKFLIDPTRN